MSSSERPPLLIRASAGTGKTYALSSRFIALLAAGEAPDRILATTFTRKAAAEIKERIFIRLAQAALDPAAARQIAAAIAVDNFSSAQAAALLQRLLQHQQRLLICTLDSFCARLAKVFAPDLGLNLDWCIASEVDEIELCRQALDQICRKVEGPLPQLVNLLNQGYFKRPVYEQLKSIVQKWHELYRQAPASAWEWLEAPPPLAADRVAQLIKAHTQLKAPRTKAGKEHSGFRKGLDQAAALLQRQSWRDFTATTLAQTRLAGGTQYYRLELPAEMIGIYDELLAHARALLLSDLAQQTRATRDLLAEYDRSYQDLKNSSGRLSFADIKFLLAQAALGGRLHEVYYRLDSQIAHLLLDEFQDTAMAEWQILEPIAAEILAKGAGDYSFFCVGDVKQAIYGWRGGVAEIFDTLEQRWTHLTTESQDQSRRCAPAIIDTVNAVYTKLDGNSELAAYPAAVSAWRRRFQPHAALSADRSGYAALLSAGRDSEADEATVVAATVALAAKLQRLAPTVGIGILVRRKATVARIIYELRQAGLAASEEGGNPLSDSPAVAAVLALLRLIDHPADTVAGYHTAKSPLGAIVAFKDYQNPDAARELSCEWRRRLLYQGYGPTLADLCRKLRPFGTSRDRRRLEQLVDLAYEVDRQRPLRTRPALLLAQLRRREDPAAAAIRVMTIHQSKGLEFAAVILPELDVPLSYRGQADLLIGRSSPVTPPERIVRPGNKAIRALAPALAAMYQEGTEQDVKESLSLLYVAMTRARDALYMLTAGPKSATGTFAALLQAALLQAALIQGALMQAALNTGQAEEEAEGECLFGCGDPQWYRQDRSAVPPVPLVPVPPPAQPPAAAIKMPRTIAFRPGGARIQSHESPSEQEGRGQRDLPLWLNLEGRAAARTGTLLHRCFEQIDWLPPAATEPGPRLDLLSAKPQLQSEFATMLAAPEVAAVLRRDFYQHWPVAELQLYREFPFAYSRDQTVVNGIIDRLVVGRSQGQAHYAEVLDFKTDRIDSAAALAERCAYYRPQLERYREAAGRICKLPARQISARLIFVRAAKVMVV